MKSNPPAPPDYAALALAQGKANKESAIDTAHLNNPNIITPYGTQTTTYGGNTLNEADYSAAMQKYNTDAELYNRKKVEYDDRVAINAYHQFEGGSNLEPFTLTAPVAPDKSGFMYGDPTQATVTQTLAPEQQALLDKQTQVQGKLSDVGLSAANRVEGILGQQFNIDGAPALQQYNSSQLPGMPTALNQSALPGQGNALDMNSLSPISNAQGTRASVRDAMLSRVNTDISRDRDSVKSSLVAAGIPIGSEAYNREMEQLDRQQTDSRYQAELAAGTAAHQQFGQDLSLRDQQLGAQGQQFGQMSNLRSQATGEQGQQFGQSQAIRQQGVAEGQIGQETSEAARRQAISEALMMRQMPLNEISALMSGSQVTNPFSQVGAYQGGSVVQPSPLFQAGQQQFGAEQDAYNQKVGQQNAMLQGLFGLGGAAIGGM